MRFRTGARTDVGRVREGNEDSYMVHELLFAVADGMGGHQGGEVASKLALETLQNATSGGTNLAHAVREANTKVFDEASKDPGLAGMGTTLTALMAGPDRVEFAHVGDSRAYLLREGTMKRLTEDHTVVNRLVKEGRLTVAEAELHPQRSILTNALGVDQEIQIDEGEVEIRAGDRILLCSDGLTGMISEEDIRAILTAIPDPQAAADALVEAANEAGGQDNITAVVIDVAEDRDPQGARPTETIETGRAPGAARTTPFDARPGRTWPGAVLRWVIVPLVILAAGLVAVKLLFIDRQWFVGEANGHVALYRGIPAEPLGIELATLVEETAIPASEVAALREWTDLDEGITTGSEDEAREIIAQMKRDVEAAKREEMAGTGP